MKLNMTHALMLSLILFSSTHLYAWGPIAHYIIAKEAAKIKNFPESVADYANLPDYAPSRGWYFFEKFGLLVGHYFIWSHAVIDRGSERFLIPRVPAYPDDGRYPGLVMQELLKNKLKSKKLKGSVLLDMQLTVNGFRAHNAADRVVHFEFFHGGSKENWVEQHDLKEAYAEYLILLKDGYHGNQNMMFDKNGFINLNTLDTNLFPEKRILFKGNAELMHLAQKVFRKNRRVMRRDSDVELRVQSVHDIQNHIRKQQAPFQQKVWAQWEVFYIINLVPDFPIIKENGEKVTIVPDTPPNNKAEFQLLTFYQTYTLQKWGPAGYIHDIPIGDNDDSNDWKVWDPDEIFNKFEESVQKAAQWMFPLEDLTPPYSKKQSNN